MGNLLNIFNQLHKNTKRDYVGRMTDNKVECMKTGKQYEYDYWDGDRRYGYGGYKYDGRWKVVAEDLVRQYNLSSDAKILDAGCGKGFLLYELKQLLPDAQIKGFDISEHALKTAKEEIRDVLYCGRAEDPYPYEDNAFDLVISLNVVFNLNIYDVKKALAEIERVGRNKYIVLESYRNESELFNLQCWALTCESFFSPEEWEWLFQEFGYSGDYEFIYFE
ncbi:MAG: class I SAM-dependent methyltransferase [Nitrospira sp.]|nr:class I SAM-dependent methyltransferase [bacterium]MBL7048025.1 class I SAM-dependent methyltransferase [Nitrospira sp.]